MKPKAPSSQVVDTRSPNERALAESQAKHFRGLMAQPDWGYKSEWDSYAPIRERKRTDYKKDIGKWGAERGFGILGSGVQEDMFARGSQEMGEQEAAEEAQNKMSYKDWVASSGRAAATPQGRSVMMTPGRPSAFGALMGPVMGGIGSAFGGPLGGALGAGFGGMFGGGGGQSSMSDQVRSQQQPEGFGGAFGRSWRSSFR